MSENNSNIVSSAISSGSGFLSSIWDTIWANKNIEKTLDTNKELSDYQYSKDVEMWNRQNEYNSPSSQMARLKEAGLNPNLVYGTGAVGNTSSQLPKYNAPTAKFDSPAPFKGQSVQQGLQMYMDITQRQAVIDKVKSETELTQQKTLTEAVSRAWKALLTNRDQFRFTQESNWDEISRQQKFNLGQEKYRQEGQRTSNLIDYSRDTAQAKRDLAQEQVKIAQQIAQQKSYETDVMSWKFGSSEIAKFFNMFMKMYMAKPR